MELLTRGFYQSKNDYSLFIKQDGNQWTIAAVYVDDIILTGDNSQGINKLKYHLHQKFNIKDLGRLNYFLGIEIGYIDTGIIMTQKKFTKELLSDAGLSQFKLVVTFLPLNLKLQSDEGALCDDPSLYRCFVGKLNFLTHTLAYTVQHLSQFLQTPRVPHFEALMHTLKYVGSTVGQGIILKASDQLILKGYSDYDWGACLDSRRSITGYIMLLGQSPVS